MNEQYIKEHYGFEDVRNVVAKLRDKDGCPWDREQTVKKECRISGILLRK